MKDANKVKKWRELSRKLVFQKFSRKIEKVIYELPDGSSSDFYIKKEGPAVCVLALTSNKQIVLVKQFRPGPQKILAELPGGYVNNNEKPEETAERELLEETGYKGKIQAIGTCLDDAYSTMLRYCFIATECQRVSGPKLDKNEYVQITLLSVPDFIKLLRAGETTDAEVGYRALDFLKLL